MTSGIYRLVFKNGSSYIGKSNDIGRRFEEHEKKLLSGKAAAKLQQAFDTGEFERADILCVCHPDHIDLMETCMILLHKPDLNSARTVCVDDANYLLNASHLEKSTTEHLKLIDKLEYEISDLKEKIRVKKRSDLELERDKALDHAEYWHEKYKEERDRSWWSRLF